MYCAGAKSGNGCPLCRFEPVQCAGALSLYSVPVFFCARFFLGSGQALFRRTRSARRRHAAAKEGDCIFFGQNEKCQFCKFVFDAAVLARRSARTSRFMAGGEAFRWANTKIQFAGVHGIPKPSARRETGDFVTLIFKTRSKP